MREPAKTGNVLVVILALAVAALAGALLATVLTDQGPVMSRIDRPNVPAPREPDEAEGRDDLGARDGRFRRVAEAARAAVGGGTVSEVDRSDDPGESWEVEVITRRGEVDVALDAELRRIPNAAYED